MLRKAGQNNKSGAVFIRESDSPGRRGRKQLKPPARWPGTYKIYTVHSRSVCCDCCNEGQLKQPKLVDSQLSHSLDAGVQNQGLPSEGAKESCVVPGPSPSFSWCLGLWQHISLPSSHAFFLCVCPISPFYTDTSHIGSGAHPTPASS